MEYNDQIHAMDKLIEATRQHYGTETKMEIYPYLIGMITVVLNEEQYADLLRTVSN